MTSGALSIERHRELFLQVEARNGIDRDIREDRQVDVTLLSGPFKRLANRWQVFEAEGGATRVEFDIDFQFKSRLLEALLAANFAHAVDRLMSCFEARAKALYGLEQPDP